MSCGMCLHASGIGVDVPGDPIAYIHPGCPNHGRCPKFTSGDRTDGDGRPLCRDCLAYEDEHLFTPEETQR